MLKLSVLILGILALQQALSRMPAEPQDATPLPPHRIPAAIFWEHPALGRLDDPANPFAGQYDALDLWIQQHQLGVLEPLKLQAPAESSRYQSPYCAAAACLTTRLVGGYPLPYREHLRRYFEALSEQRATEYMSGGPLICAAGPLSPGQAQACERLVWEAEAAYFPAVPDWLAAAPPLKARLLPSGQVLVLGRLGSGSGLSPSELKQGLAAGPAADLYSARGELLVRGKPELWLPLCGRLDCLRLQREGALSLTADKYLELRAPGTRRLLKLWDFDGRPLPLDAPREQRSLGFTWLTPQQLSQLYQAQHRLGAHSPQP